VTNKSGAKPYSTGFRGRHNADFGAKNQI